MPLGGGPLIPIPGTNNITLTLVHDPKVEHRVRMPRGSSLLPPGAGTSKITLTRGKEPEAVHRTRVPLGSSPLKRGLLFVPLAHDVPQSLTNTVTV
jgi:hypothetical protein